MTMAGKVFVVAGGAGVAGECVVDALLAEGATVAVPSRSSTRLAQLRQAHPSPHLHTYVGGVDHVASALDFIDRVVADHGPPDGVVAALGGWWEGTRLTELDEETWRGLMDANLNSHFVAARAFLPALVGGSDAAYVWLNGVAGDKAVPTAGPVSVAGAAQRMLVRVLAEELAETGVRLHEVTINTPVVTRHWEDGRPIEPGWLSGETVGRYVVDVLANRLAEPAGLLLAIP